MLFLLFLLAIGSCPAQAPVPGRGLRLQPFDPLPGLYITAINSNGDIAGYHVLYGAVSLKSGGAMQVLGFDGRVSALNDHGQMLVNGDNQVFLRQPDGTMEPRTIEGGKSVVGYGINNLGEIVGSADLEAVAWDASGAARRISIPRCGSFFGTPRNSAVAINDNGEMIVETQCPAGSFRFYRRAANGELRYPRSTKFGIGRAGLSNHGDLFYSYSDAYGGHTYLLDAADRTLYYASRSYSPFNDRSENLDRTSLLAMSLEGTRLAGAGFLAAPCPAMVRSRAMYAPLTGAVAIDVSAGEDCHWYAWQTYRGTESVTLPVTGNVGSEPQASAAGVDIPIPAAGSCQYASPGGQLKAPVEGAEFSVPVQTAPGCVWTIGVSPGITAKPMSGSGPGEVTVTVAPSQAFADQWKSISIAGIRRDINIEGWRCFYDVDALLPFAAGSTTGHVTVSTPSACRWSLFSVAPWIHTSRLSFDPVFRLDPNLSNSPRTAELWVGSKIITVTQQAALPGAPLLVEPNNGSGPSAVFRFTFAEGESPVALIRVGADCLLNYDRVTGAFTPTGDACRWNSTEAKTMAGLLTITASVDFASRGRLPIMAGDHTLGVFTATDSFPEVPAPIEPAENIGWLPPAHFQLNRTAGSGGLFRFVFSAQQRVAQSNIGSCSFVLDAAQGTLQLYGGQQGRIGANAQIENDRCVIDLEKSRLSPGSAKHVLDLPIQFRSTSTGDYITGTQFSLPSDPSPGWYLSGEFTVLPAVAPPTGFYMDGLLRVGFPSRVPVDRARVVIGACSVEYVGPGVFQAKGCELADSESHVIGNDLILLLRFKTPVSGALSAEQTPHGGIASGLFPLGSTAN
ncbi:MAG: BACON domain-containing protein [Acidobacteria bacterium]|nr:BACON domain-containing protein [Acidobacteriota bacterium]